MSVEEFVEYAALYDVYGPLLTTRQAKIFELYYMKNMSMSEIAQQMQITRQGVADSIASAKKQLKTYETKLKFIKKQKDKIKQVRKLLNKLENDFDRKTFARINAKIIELLG